MTSEELHNKVLESVKRGLTLLGETGPIEIIESLESDNLPKQTLFNHAQLTAQSFGINISRSTGILLNENELGARHPEQTTLLDFRKGEEE
jgi:hypothetical protein